MKEQRVDKPGTRVPDDSQIDVRQKERYVGRGGTKLEAGLRHFHVDAANRVCLDIGASTGGFTDCLLQHGAIRVYAYDVGHDQLDWKIRSDPRVVVREKVNARYLSRGDFPEPISLCVIDVSFISLTLILPVAGEIVSTMSAPGTIIALIKPQFELEKGDVGRGGIVREAALHQRAVDKIRNFCELQLPNWRWTGVMDSPILGAEGNKEFLACLRKLIGLVAHPGKKGVAALAAALYDEFAKRDTTLWFDEPTALLLGRGVTGHNVVELGAACELIIVLGGDGTILSTVHALGEHIRPIFGINLGTLGFLTCLGPADHRQAVASIVAGGHVLSRRSLLEVQVIRDGAVTEQHLGLNDAVISRGALSRLIRLETHVDGALLTEYNADGLIVATPTGSTAYSLSAGGPLLTPESNVFAITPICPHTLTNRSVIISDQACVEVRIRKHDDEIYLTVDGQRAIAMRSTDWVKIKRSEKVLPLAMMPDLPFFELARRKLKWSGNTL